MNKQENCLLDCTHLDLKLEIDLKKEELFFIDKDLNVIDFTSYNNLSHLEQSKYKIKNIQEYIVNNFESIFLKYFIFKELNKR